MKHLTFIFMAMVFMQISCNKENNGKPAQEVKKPPLNLEDGSYTIYFDSIADSNGKAYMDDQEHIKKKDNKLYSWFYWRTSVYTCDTPICDSIFFFNDMITFYNFRTIGWRAIGAGGIYCFCDTSNYFKITSLYWDNDNKLNGHFQSYNYDADNNKVKVNGHFRFWPE